MLTQHQVRELLRNNFYYRLVMRNCISNIQCWRWNPTITVKQARHQSLSHLNQCLVNASERDQRPSLPLSQWQTVSSELSNIIQRDLSVLQLCQVAAGTKFGRVACNIWGSSVPNLFHVIFLAPRILRWLLGF